MTVLLRCLLIATLFQFVLLNISLAKSVKVTADVPRGSLKMYSGPGESYPVIETLPPGTIGVRQIKCQASGNLSAGQTWCQIEWNDKIGWASSCCIEPFRDFIFHTIYDCKFNPKFGDKIELRERPGGPAIKTVDSNDNVSLNDLQDPASRGAWLSVMISGSSKYFFVPSTAISCAGDHDTFPIVINDYSILKSFPIAVFHFSKGEEMAALKYPCYEVGHAGLYLSLGEEFVQKYEERGFSRRALCMAMVSEIHYDPEDGHRLQSILLRSGGQEDVVFSYEIPMEVPACFKGGRPLWDCTFNYDPNTGDPIDASKQARIHELGAFLNRALPRLFLQSCGAYSKQCRIRKAEIVDLSQEGRFVALIPQEKLWWSTDALGEEWSKVYRTDFENVLSFYDYSSELPGGFGYALFADAPAGPAMSAQAIKYSLSGTGAKSQIDPRKVLKSLMK
jgi:hypothetical protein